MEQLRERVPSIREGFLPAGDLRLHVVEAGPEDGPLVVLLHGFPEFWYSWRQQIGPLAEAGYRVLVPDQRGYNQSDKPRRVRDYRLEQLGQDVLHLVEAAGRRTASVVGHDWGAVVGWWLGSHHPDRLERLALLNVPHPAVMRHHLLTNRKQLRRSWYIFFFQLPWLPERLLGKDGFSFAARSLRDTSRRGTFTDEALDRYREAWSRPGALRSMLHWYRAAFRGALSPYGPTRVPVETLLIWGARDTALGREMARPSLERCDRGQLAFVEEATHWVQHEEPERVNALLLRHLRGESVPDDA